MHTHTRTHTHTHTLYHYTKMHRTGSPHPRPPVCRPFACNVQAVDPTSNADVYVPCVAALPTQRGGDPNNEILSGNMIWHFKLDEATGKLTPASANEPLVPPPTGYSTAACIHIHEFRIMKMLVWRQRRRSD